MNKNTLNKLMVLMFIDFTALTFWSTIAMSDITDDVYSAVSIEAIQLSHDEAIQV